MSKDGLYAVIETGFIRGAKFLSLPVGARLLYISIWCYALEQKREIIELPPNDYLSRIAGLYRHPIATYLQCLHDAHLTLLQPLPNPTHLVVVGLAKKHNKIKFKETSTSVVEESTTVKNKTIEKKTKENTTASATEGEGAAAAMLSFVGFGETKAKEILAAYTPEQIIRAAEHAIERADRNPAGMFLRLVDDPLGPSTAERTREAEERARVQADLKAAHALRVREAEECEAEESARWARETWPSLSESERAEIDRDLEANPFTSKITDPAARMLAREALWRKSNDR